MLRAFFLSVGQLGDRRILWVLVKSLAVTLVLLAGLGVGLWYGLERLAMGFDWGEAAGLAGLAAALGILAAAWLLFRVVAIAVIGVFADDVVEAVEDRHYPDQLAVARRPTLAQSIGMGLGSAGRALLVNLALLPLYLILLVTGIGTAIVFFMVNGWLLGRDLGDMVAVRHMPADALPTWRTSNRLRRFVLGLAGTGLFLVPVLNIVAPVLGAAMATHLFHRRRDA